MSGPSITDDIDDIRERNADELNTRGSAPIEPVRVEGSSHFEKILDDHSPVLVDFYADWCGPCKMLEPTLESLAADTAGTIAKVDVDDHQELSQEYDVQGVPTLYLFVDGEPVERIVGVQDEGSLRKLVESHV